MNKIFTKNIYTNYKHVLKMNSLAFLKGFLLGSIYCGSIILGADIDGTFRCVKTKTLHPSAHYVY